MTASSHSRPSWLDMVPVEFDTALAPTRKARKFAATAGETLFPRLMPQAERQPAAELPPQIDGQDSLFGDLS